MAEKEKKRRSKSAIPIISFIVAVLLFVLPKVLTKTKVDFINALDVLSVIIAFSSILGWSFSQFVNQNAQEHKNLEERLDVFSNDFTPQNYAPAGNEPNAALNEIIKNEMCKSRCHYFYFSHRAFYLVWRLNNYQIDRRTSDFTIALPALDQEKIFNAVADNWIESEKPAGMKTTVKSERIMKARLDAYKSIYFVKRLIEEEFTINLVLHSEIPFIRFELTDNIIAMSFLPMTSGGKYLPTILYNKGSLNWDAFNAYSKQIVEGSPCLTKTAQIDEYLKAHFNPNQLGVHGNYEEFIGTMEEEYKKTISEQLK